MTSPANQQPTINHVEALYQQALQLLNRGNFIAAEKLLKELTCRFPEEIDCALALGDCLHQQKKLQDASVLYDSLLKRFPESAALWNNRGVTLYAMGQSISAMHSFLQALRYSPGMYQAKVALASCYQALGLFEQALSCCDEVLAQNRFNAEAHWNKALLLLLAGKYREGWLEYEWRWKRAGFTSPRRNFPQPTWRGEDAVGATILVHAEQGFGDTLQFCRYLPLLEQRGLSVVFECHAPLVALAKTLSSTITVLALGAPLPSFDLQVPLLSLPLAFGTDLENIPVTIPYLAAPDRHLLRWQKHSGVADKRLKVGLCWAGKQYPDPSRSCPAVFLRDFGLLEGIDWYSLQMGWNDPLPISMIDLSGEINDFADTAELLSRLDLVITIDTAVAHLSGALGIPTWIMLPFVPDWRWLLSRDDSPWYPGMKLFRQDSPGNWSNTILSICSALQSWKQI